MSPSGAPTRRVCRRRTRAPHRGRDARHTAPRHRRGPFRGGATTTLTLPRALTAQQLRATHDDVRRQIDTLLDAVIEGRMAAELYVPAIHKRLVSRLDHAAYLGRELARAERALLIEDPYVQDAAPESGHSRA